MEFRIETERLFITSFDFCYLEDIFNSFSDEIVMYQYPDSFADLATANKTFSRFACEMEDGKMLELVILSHEKEFLGCLEVLGLKEKYPELGIWLKKDAHGEGYGYEALHAVINYLCSVEKYAKFIYEADIRNEQSIGLVRKFTHELGEVRDVVTESGKKLRLQVYYIYS